MKLRVGTRRSPLALTQTGQAMRELAARRPGLEYELVEVTTTGDRIVDRPLREAGGKGLFLKELDEALLEGRIDCAVHSMKDVPTDLAPGTVVAAVPERADARDVLVTRDGCALSALPGGAVIGTTSLRRQSQALAAVRGASIRMLRGNVETRLRKLVAGEYDATFLAAAGLARLGIDLFSHGGGHGADGSGGARGVALDPFVFVPAPGQGALALTARAGDERTLESLAAMDHEPARIAVTAERAFARMFGGGCSLPLASYAERRGHTLVLVGVLLAADGSEAIRDEVAATLSGAGDAQRAEELGRSLAESFFSRGAARLVALAEGSA